MLTCYEFGMLLLEKVAPKQFHDKEMEGLRTFYPGNMGEDMLERMVFKPWLELWLKHLEWYIKAVSDYSLPLQYPLSPPLVPLSTSRGRRRVHIFRYGFLFQLYDRLRTSPAPFRAYLTCLQLLFLFCCKIELQKTSLHTFHISVSIIGCML